MMAASSGDGCRQHRGGAHRDNREAALDAAPAAWHTPVRRAGALAAGFVAGAGAVANTLPAALGGSPPTVHRDDIALTDLNLSGTTTPTPTFDDSLHYLLDTFLGVGTNTLPEVFAPNASLTVGQLLGMSSNGVDTVNTELPISSLLQLLGLNNIDVSDVMAALNLNVSRTLDTMLGTGGALQSLGSTTLNQILTPLGVPTTQTLYGLADRMSLLNQTLETAFSLIGPIKNASTQTVQSAMESIGLGSFYSQWVGTIDGFCSGFSGTVEAALNCVVTDYSNTGFGKSQGNEHGAPAGQTQLSSKETLGYLLTHVYQLQPSSGQAALNEPIGAYTIGQILDINPTTTIKNLVDGVNGYGGANMKTPIEVNLGVTQGQFSGGISTTTGSPVGTPVVTTINNNPVCGCNGASHTVTVAPADDNTMSNPDGTETMPVVPLGGLTWGQILTWLNVPPTESVATLIDNLWVNDVQLGHYTIGAAMDGMIVAPLTTGLTNGEVTDATTVQQYLTAIGFDNWTLDQLIGLSPPP